MEECFLSAKQPRCVKLWVHELVPVLGGLFFFGGGRGGVETNSVTLQLILLPVSLSLSHALSVISNKSGLLIQSGHCNRNGIPTLTTLCAVHEIGRIIQLNLIRLVLPCFLLLPYELIHLT